MDAKGQSIIEVVIILPFLFLFVTVLFKFNLATQMSINNAQYARSQLFVLTANSAEYPRLEFRSKFVVSKQDMMLLGVADPEAIKQAGYSDSLLMEPIPQTQKLDRFGKNIKGSSERGEAANRNEIRVRNTAAICTQINQVPEGGSFRWPFKQAGVATVCQYEGQWIGDSQ